MMAKSKVFRNEFAVRRGPRFGPARSAPRQTTVESPAHGMPSKVTLVGGGFVVE